MKWVDVSIFWPQQQIELSESRKPYLNLCSQRWIIPSVSLVSNLIPLELWHLKILFPEGHINFKSFFLKINKFSELLIFWSGLFHSITTEGKNEFCKKNMFYFELWNSISISCVVWSHRSKNNIEEIFWRLVYEYFKEEV